LTIDGTKATEAGNYTVTRVLGGDVKVLQEVVKEQEVSVGKRTEKTQYRSYEFTHINGKNLTETDNLYSVEELIGTTGNDSNLLIVFYVQIMPDDFVMQLHR
ncbi:hypothetical protein NQ240_24775, partial [Escherichia coli]|nr:hypothetical protein [Escherichia coli]